MSKLTSTRAIPRQGTSRTAFTAEPPDEDDPLLGFAPYIHKAPRRNSITPDRQRRFIATLAATGIVRQAALSIGASLEALYKLRQRRGHRYAPLGKAPLRPEDESPDEIIAEIDAQLDRMREAWLKEQEAGSETA